jgi:hypothetical protein
VSEIADRRTCGQTEHRYARTREDRRMTHVGHSNVPEMPLPSPWLMGVIAIGAGVTLWWLTPDVVRRKEERGRPHS